MSIIIDGRPRGYAESAAQDCFWLLKNIEEQLSMFVEHSEISLINRLEPGQTCMLLESTMQALAGAMYVSALSGGAVDVCMGEHFLKAKKKADIENPRAAKIALAQDGFLIQKIEDGKIDLGAIGKGFAVDMIAERLSSIWEIDSAFISFGGSSILALDPPEGADSWELTFAGRKLDGFKMKNCAIGASGTAVQGEHIIDCRTGRPPANAPYRAWAICDNALLADGISTAFMILDRDSIREICKKENMRAAIQATPDGEIEFIA